MSDSEAATPVVHHPSIGGKSLTAFERPRYKSWRKKYRKMHAKFDNVLEENKRLFREEIKLEAIAKRLREELDGLLELCLDLNDTPSVPPDLRFDISIPRSQIAANIVHPNISPEQANAVFTQYKLAVQEGRHPSTDLQIMRQHIEQRLAAQEVPTLAALEACIPHTIPTDPDDLPDDIKGDDPPGYLTSEQEIEYLLRHDTKLGETLGLTRTAEQKEQPDERHLADLTPRELERMVEFQNPQSQHNWLRTHTKVHANGDGGADDTESFISHDPGAKTGRKRGGAKNLAKQVGDRAVERAREGFSPSAASGYDEDELGYDKSQNATGSGRKKPRDPDGTYRIKGGKTTKGKRKRNSLEDGGLPAGEPAVASIKKPRMESLSAD